MNLGQVGQVRKDLFVPERDVDESMVDKGGEGVGDGDLLPATLGAGGDEDAAHLAGEGGPAPEGAGCVPERLPLHGEVAEACGNAEKESVKVEEVVGEKDGVVGAWGCLDEPQNVLGEGFLDLVDRSTTAGVYDAALDGLGEFGNMPVEGVNNDGNSGARYGFFRKFRGVEVQARW